VKASISHSSSADSRVFRARYVILCLLFVFSISVTDLMSNLKRSLITDVLWTQSRHHGGFWCS